MAIREGRWRCSHCKAENLGRHRTCVGLDSRSGCGRKRGNKVVFYLPENAAVVTDPALLKLAKAGPDREPEWSETVPRASVVRRRPTPQETPRAAPEPVAALRIFGRNPVDRDRIEHETRAQKARMWKIGTLVAAFVLCVAIVVWRLFFATLSVEAHIEGFAWSRSISIERYQTVREADWYIPTGGREVSSEWKIRRYDQVLDHYETRTREVSETVQSGSESYSCGTRDLGNGFFEDQTCTRPIYTTQYRTESYEDPVYRDEPVYDTYYTYDIDKWLHDRTKRSSGTDQDAEWPAYTLSGEAERLSGRAEAYTVNFQTTEGETIPREYPESEWEEMKKGQKFRIDRNRVGFIKAIERL